MAKDKERSVNPAQQQRKLEKAKQLKKSRAELQAKRNEKLARRNPERIQRQIEDLRALEQAGELKSHEKAILEDLERDLKAVRKARATLGEKESNFPRQHRPRGNNDKENTVLGKRGRDGERKHSSYSGRASSGSDTDDSVRRIPMPEDTPPPVPRNLKRYYPKDGRAPYVDTSLPSKPTAVAMQQLTYSSAPQIRDLRKEAIDRFVPDVVRKKQEAAKGGLSGQLIEPEEMDRLEEEGYLRSQHQHRYQRQQPAPHAVDNDDITAAKRLAEEEQRFLRELEMQDAELDGGQDDRNRSTVANNEPVSSASASRHVEIEDVEDEDG